MRIRLLINTPVEEDRLIELLDIISQCEGDVDLIGEDIRLNLKSQLTQYFAINKLLNNDKLNEKLEIVAHNPSDLNKILEFMSKK